ncbi:unnamed protein product, partial [Adineta ricciae]
LEVGGQAQSATISNTRTTTTTNTVNAGPYIPVLGPSAAQRLSQPIRAPFMSHQQQQQQQRPVRPPGPSQLPPGIPSYTSQVEGLSVSQAVVNDVLVDLQSKVINETLQQYQDAPVGGEPLPPIYIQAPQPTIILRSDMNRLRAELNSTVRPQVIYRNPEGAEQHQQQQQQQQFQHQQQQFQQQQQQQQQFQQQEVFQQNNFQIPQFPSPAQQQIPPECYGEYRNAVFANSDEYKATTTTITDEQRSENEARFYNQADSTAFNDDSINANMQNTLDLQGLSATSFEQRDSPYQSSLYPPNFDEQQQGNEKITSAASQYINNEEIGQTDNMHIHQRQDITFDIDNCIMRCFEAHRQRLARRRAARQARRAKRQKQSGHQRQHQQHQHQANGFQTFSSQGTYSPCDDTIHDSIKTSASVRTSEASYPPTAGLDYGQGAQSNVLSTDASNTQTTQIPYSTNIQSTAGEYHQFNPLNIHDTYGAYQRVPSANNELVQQPHHDQASYDYANQLQYSSFAPTDSTVPGGIQHRTSDYYQQQPQQQTAAQFLQSQETHIQQSNAYDYLTGSAQTQLPTYDYANIGQESSQYPYDIEGAQQQQQQTPLNYDTLESAVYVPSSTDIQQAEQKQTFNYANQTLSPADYYQQQALSVPISQNQEAYSQPTGTYEYTKESFLSQEPVYDYQNVEQQASQFTYDAAAVQQISQPGSYEYPTAITNVFSPTQIGANANCQQQQQQQAVSASTPQAQQTYAQSQIATYDYQNLDQQPSIDYSSADTGTYISPEANIQQTEQKTTYDYTSQALSSSDYYQQHQTSVPTSQAQGTFDQGAGTFDYVSGNTQAQLAGYDQQNTEQQSYQYPFNIDNTEHQQPQDFASEHTGTYKSPEAHTQRTEQKQTYDYTSQALSASEFFPQPSASGPASQLQRTFDQQAATFDYSKQSFQNKEPLFDYQSTDQPSSHYSYNGEDTRQQLPQLQEQYNYPSEATTLQSPTVTELQQSEQRQRLDYLNQTLGSTDQFQQKPVSIPISQVYDSQPPGRRSHGASIPTGTVEYTRRAFYSQETVPDNSPRDSYRQQRGHHEESESFSINDYLKRFESESISQQAGGQMKSSDDYQSISTTTTTPNTVQPTADIYQPTGLARNYDLQHYTNDSIESATPRSVLPTSSTCEEDHQHLLHQTSVSEQIHEQIPPSDVRSDELEGSIYDTYSSLPPPPPSLATRDTNQQQGSVTTSGYDFPAPPTPDRHSYQTGQKRPSRSIASIVPSVDQQSIYSAQQPIPLTSPTTSDNRSEDDDDDTKEDEEIFDLRECIARCYAKYRESWNHEQQRQYEQQLMKSQQPIIDIQQMTSQQSTRTSISHTNQQFIQPPRQTFGSDEVHYSDGWTQTASHDVMKLSNIAQHTYDQTPSTFDTQPYVPQSSTKDFATDSRGQQTIEYTPPLVASTQHAIPTVPITAPSPYNEYMVHEQKQQQQQQQQQEQQVYDHGIPAPSHSSFNETDYQSNVHVSSQITPEAQKYENTPFSKQDEEDEQQQQHRYRAHSEPVSIQQDSLISTQSSQQISSHIIDQQSRRSNSIPMIHQQEQQQQQQARVPTVRMLDDGRAYETDATFERTVPMIDPKTGMCLVPCPESQKYAHLPPHLRPELFCIELPPAGSLPPMPPAPEPTMIPPPMMDEEQYQQQQQYHHQQQQQQQHPQGRWCVRCCCVPGQTLIKKVVYKQVEEGGEQHEDHHQFQEDSDYDYAAVLNQMGTRISVRYGNSLMEDSEPFVPGNYSEQLRIIDFPVYVSGKDDPKLTPLVPVN